MTLICFKNGSLAREKVRDLFGLDWAGFSQALDESPPGNDGKLMLPYFEPEIVPHVLEAGVRRHRLDEQDMAGNCRAVVEAQMMSMRIHSAWMDIRPRAIYATGGASANPQILRVMADVHRCPVYRFETTNSAALGAALRAAHGFLAHQGAAPPWPDVIQGFAEPVLDSRIEPRPETEAIYDELTAAYAAFENQALGGS
jgi:xylulokinase